MRHLGYEVLADLLEALVRDFGSPFPSIGSLIFFDLHRNDPSLKYIIAGIPGHLGAVTLIQNNKNMLNVTGILEGTFDIETSKIRDVIYSASAIFIATTANEYGEVVRHLAEFDLSKRTLFVIPENGFSAVARGQMRPEFWQLSP